MKRALHGWREQRRPPERHPRWLVRRQQLAEAGRGVARCEIRRYTGPSGTYTCADGGRRRRQGGEERREGGSPEGVVSTGEAAQNMFF